MRVGAFGQQLVFEVSDQQATILSKIKREISGSWGNVERIGQKPLPYFSGPELQTITMEVSFNAMLGVRPRRMLERIEKLVESGQAEILVIGRRRVGSSRWCIKKSSETWDTVLQGGELLRATVSLTLQEYL